MVLAVYRICCTDSQDHAGPIFHSLVATSSVFWHNWCCRGGGQAHSTIEATACTDFPRKCSLIHTFQEMSSSLCTYGRGCPGPSKSSQAYPCSSSKYERLSSYLLSSPSTSALPDIERMLE
jgi:hypothetical protein